MSLNKILPFAEFKNSILENTQITIKTGVLPICPTTKRMLIGHHKEKGWNIFNTELSIPHTEPNYIKVKTIESFKQGAKYGADLDLIPIYTTEEQDYKTHIYIGLVSDEFPPNLGDGYDSCMWVTYIDLVMISPKDPTFKRLLRSNTSKIITYMAGCQE